MRRNVFASPSRFAFLVVGSLGLALFGARTADAQVTGKVIGTVTDVDTGQPLVGAQVVVEGTNLGNVTNEDGYYFINNVPVGVQGIVAQYLGYQTTAQEYRVLAGQTMTVDFRLASEVVQADAIIAVIEREPLVARDNTISKARFTAEDAINLPVESVNEIITLSAGVHAGQGGFIIRGGRGTESATYVDGALITDFSNQLNRTSVGNFAVEEIDVITGGFNAEFGNAQSGIINIVTREGGRQYHGNVRYTTDGQFGTDGYEIDELASGDPSAIGSQACCGYNAVQASIGGPIIPDQLSFFGSLDAQAAADYFPTAAGFNPAVGEFNSTGSTETILPGNRGDQTDAQAKLTAFLGSTSKVTGTYLFSRGQQEFYDFLGAPGGPQYGLFQFMDAAQRTKTHDVIVGYDQQLYQTAEQSLNLQVRGNWHRSDLFQGTPRNEITAGLIRDVMGADCGADCDVTGDAFDPDFLNFRFGDVGFFFEDVNPGELPVLGGLTIGARDPDPIFGVTNVYLTEFGLANFFNRTRETRTGLRADLDAQINRVHRAKVGVEWQWIDLQDADSRYTDAVFADFYDVQPMVGAAYVQDRLDYGDLVIDLGLRWDHWNPNTTFPLFAGVVPCEISVFDQCSPEAESVEAPTRNELAPRIGVAHPITDATQVRLSYGKFYQLPQLQHYFAAYATDFVAAGGNNNILYGNPLLEHVETTAFEAGITHLINENLVLDLVGYNRDRRGAIRVDVFQAGSISETVEERRIFTNADNGNVKGFDVTLNKRYSNYFSTDLAWSLQWARGTTSSPIEFATGAGFGRLFDPLFPGRLLTPPSELTAEAFDRLHNINWQFQLRFPNGFREGTALGTVFEDFSAFLVYNAQSGNPFTRRSTAGQGEALEDIGGSRLPWIHSGDIRVTRGFSLSDALHVDLFAVVENFLDIKNVINVNPTTGRPDRTGFEETLSRTPVISSRFAVEGGSTTFETRAVCPAAACVPLDQIIPEYRATFARQDLDGNGVIELAEAQEALRRALIASGSGGPNAGQTGDFPFNYGEPRQFRFGAELRF
ncbi:MAG TPA: TonB-dependent receptor [Gemmatimonadota bacterium]|nr:TonB-dependent receptor [Gemmatimonadota bacterium]